ncbi:DUF1553 domain-containing protein [Rhabdobacter roseus]|uniref:Cytochrome c553 n=1 Tax=Rhabdobacter roseus TaxID=1655419 RepID=A0A840TEM8_9BACT|nr:DUF1553 domain-containing protein [Rhabdobacter roseus]MBB5282576.1 cytochrome c553 [Rhabdobacter roseus]
MLYRSLLMLLLAGLAASCSSVDLPEEVAAAMEEVPEAVDYNLHVKPILSDKCFACHGPDQAKQKADLRLDLADFAYHKQTESGRKAIEPGRPSRSELVYRILTTDPDAVMPTPESHLTLTPLEKATLVRWIDQGAEYKPHWAFVAPQEPKLPKVKQRDWPKNEIDYFVLNKLEKQGLAPSPEADRETLIRRVSFDLTGLPPTLADIDAFVQDTSPQAYEKMVDKYLRSVRYGERMAAYWLDVARFADSHGYLDDKHRDMSPWRDWVISAFNRNLSFDKFISWQLAGDLLPNATQEQILATGFNRNHKQNSEAGIIEEEYRVEYVTDRTNTLGKAFLGLTVECAKCHDHKYDPISQKDYYSLYAFFNSTFEKGSPNYGGEDVVPGPTLLLTQPEHDRKIAELKKHIAQQEKKVPQVPSTSAAPGTSLGQKLVAHLAFEKLIKKQVPQPKGAPRAVEQFVNLADPSTPAEVLFAEAGEGVLGQSLKINADTRLNLPPYKVGYFERHEPFAISLWVKVPEVYDKATLVYHTDTWRYGNQGYDLILLDNKVNFRLMHAFPHDALSVLSTSALQPNRWYHLAASYDGSSRAAGMSLYLDGQKVPTTTEYDHLVKNIRSRPNIHKSSRFNGVRIGMRDLDRSLPGGELDEFMLFDNELSASEVKYLLAKNKVAAAPPSQRQKYLSARETPLLKLRHQLTTELDSLPEVMVMGELPQPRPTHVLERGVYDSYGERVYPSTPGSLLAFPENLPKNRLGLAQWLLLPENPLTARVAVNRFWEFYFGRGLVKTTDDFGNQGELPSHPELLDYLAVQFRASGWNLKALQKRMLLSATYRQSSRITPEHRTKDPQNVWLARASRYRMPAEMIRDNALASGGLLAGKIGGKSVYPYQPAGLWDELSDKSWRYKYLEEPGEGLYRRSIYTVWKRTSPPPSMLIFDAPDRNFCAVKRVQSSSPLQALVLLNDPQFVEAARFVALRMQRESTSQLHDQLRHGYRLLTGRAPNAQELKVLERMYQTEYQTLRQAPQKVQEYLAVGYSPLPTGYATPETAALARVAAAVMNTDEYMTRK